MSTWPREAMITDPAQGGRWGIMGGTFNPIHYGHLIMAESVRESCSADGMLFLPARTHPFKPLDRTISLENRVAMVDMAIADNPHFRLEIPPEGTTYTFDQINWLKTTFPSAGFFLVVGSDIVEEFASWYKHEELESTVEIIVAARPGYHDEFQADEQLESARRVMIPQYDISSSDIRNRLVSGKSITYMVPPDVEAYIYQKGLYGAGGKK